jgi:arylsulfatase
MNMTDGASPHDCNFFYRQVAVRSGDWKLMLPHQVSTSLNPGKHGLPGEQVRQQVPLSLFNLRDDIGETHNLAAENPEVVKRLRKSLQAFRSEMALHKRPIGKSP